MVCTSVGVEPRPMAPNSRGPDARITQYTYLPRPVAAASPSRFLRAGAGAVSARLPAGGLALTLATAGAAGAGFLAVLPLSLAAGEGLAPGFFFTSTALRGEVLRGSAMRQSPLAFACGLA